jgi:predicted DNA-binding protein with PD1-like motif
MRKIKHPGSEETSHVIALPTRVHEANLYLGTGKTLLAAIVEALAPFEGGGAGLRLRGGVLENFAYYMPALSDHPEHAVYFSERYTVAGRVELEQACVTVGERNGQAWLHCHAVWIEPGGRRHCGHLIPDEVRVAEPICAQACVLSDTTFDVLADAHTNFTLFKPRLLRPQLKSGQDILLAYGVKPQAEPPLSEADTHVSALVVRIPPNHDLCLTIEGLCHAYGFECASVHGGVGSTIGAQFDDGRYVEPFVTELLISEGKVGMAKSGALEAKLDIALIDYTGQVSSGRLVRGGNPVLVTCELILVRR